MKDFDYYLSRPLEIVEQTEAVNKNMIEIAHCLVGALNYPLSCEYLAEINKRLDDFHTFMKVVSFASLDIARQSLEELDAIDQSDNIDSLLKSYQTSIKIEQTQEQLVAMLSRSQQSILEIDKYIEALFTSSRLTQLLENDRIMKEHKKEFITQAIGILTSWLKFNQDIIKYKSNKNMLHQYSDVLQESMDKGFLGEEELLASLEQIESIDENIQELIDEKLPILHNLYEAKRSLEG